MIPLWVIRYVLPGIGAVLALWAAYSWAKGIGAAEERGKWEAREIIATTAMQAKSDELQAQVDAGAVALSQMTAENERLATLAAQSRKAFYVQNPAAAGPCLHPDRLRAIQTGDDAANAAITAR